MTDDVDVNAETGEEGSEKENPMKEVAESLQGLSALPDTIAKSVASSVQTAMNGHLQAQTQAAARQKEEQDPGPPKFDGDIEEASRGDFMEHIFSTIEYNMKKVLGGVEKKVESQKEDFDVSDLKRQIEIAKSKHDDFTEFNDEMRAILGEHPDMKVDDIYHLARSRNPDKVKKLADAAAEAKKKKEDEEGKSAADDGTNFGGMFPTSGRAPTKNGRMSAEDAANAAWDQEMKDVPREMFGE